MPRGDGTGPMGMGPMTGRGTGCCSGFASPGYANPMRFTRDFGCGFGRGYGFRRMIHVTELPEWTYHGYPSYVGIGEEAPDEREILNNQAKFLEKQLQQIKKRLSSLNEGEE